MAGSGEFKSPSPGRITRTDLTAGNGQADEVAVDAFFGAQVLSLTIPSAAALIITGQVPTINLGLTLPTAALVITGQVPVIIFAISPPPGILGVARVVDRIVGNVGVANQIVGTARSASRISGTTGAI